MDRDPTLFDEAVRDGEQLLWLHAYGRRFGRPGLFEASPHDGSIAWVTPVGTIPVDLTEVRYDRGANVLKVGDGVLSGLRPDVWAFEVSGMRVVRKWIGYRTRRGAGRAATRPSPLDAIRPSTWLAEWSEELIDLLIVPVPNELRGPPKVVRTHAQLGLQPDDSESLTEGGFDL